MINCFNGVFKGKRILVTGHTGFKGSWLSIWLNELGAELVGYSLAPPTTPSNFDLCGLDQRMTHVVGDICDQAKLKKTIEEFKPELVFHLAAQPIVLASYRDPSETFRTNVMGTVSVLESVRDTDCVKAVVVVTSDKVYQDQGWYWGYRENDRLGGYDPYSASKAVTEQVVASYRSSWGQQWTEDGQAVSFSKQTVAIATARAGNVIGGGDFAPFRILPDFMRACVEGEVMEMRSPQSIRPWQHLLEPLSGYLLLAEKLLQSSGEYSEAWNFGPAEREPIDCETLIARAANLWEGSAYEKVPGQAEVHETKVLRVNWDNAAYRLNWAPSYSWEDAVAETVSWWKKFQAADGENEMYPVCVDHINDYISRARELGLDWAN